MAIGAGGVSRRAALGAAGGTMLLAGRLGAFAAEAPMTTSTRRVVAGNNAAGKSYIVSDERIAENRLWTADASRPLGDLAPGEMKGLLPSTAHHIDPPPGGSAVGIYPIMPWRVMRPMFERGEIPGHDAGGFHRTGTIDYVLVLNGTLSLVLDEGEAVLQAGDLVIQRNTLHSWRNHGEETVRILATVVRAGP